MSVDLKGRLLYYWLNRTTDRGFTLIELLVVIVIMGTLAAIALPSFLNQSTKARQAEGKQHVGALNRAQQTYYLENTTFAPTLGLLGKPIPPTTVNYQYGKQDGSSRDAAFEVRNIGQVDEYVIVTGTARKGTLKSYYGQVVVGQVVSPQDATSTSVLCESDVPTSETVSGVPYSNPPECARNWTRVSR